jgi:DNA repair protein RadC
MKNKLQLGQFYKLPSGKLAQFIQWKPIGQRLAYDFQQASDAVARLWNSQVESLELVTDSEAIAQWHEQKNSFFESKSDFLKSNPQLNNE